jgi:hypothetical protein
MTNEMPAWLTDSSPEMERILKFTNQDACRIKQPAAPRLGTSLASEIEIGPDSGPGDVSSMQDESCLRTDTLPSADKTTS